MSLEVFPERKHSIVYCILVATHTHRCLFSRPLQEKVGEEGLQEMALGAHDEVEKEGVSLGCS